MSIENGLGRRVVNYLLPIHAENRRESIQNYEKHNNDKPLSILSAMRARVRSSLFRILPPSLNLSSNYFSVGIVCISIDSTVDEHVESLNC